jgi:hypothetical protein
MRYPLLLLVAAACAIAAGVWARSARRLQIVAGRTEREFGRTSDAAIVARSAFRKDVHSAVLYAVLAVAVGAGSVLEQDARWLFAVVLVPVAVSIVFSRDFVRDSRLAESRLSLERRAEEVLSQEDLAPRRWAERLAPEVLPDVAGFEVGRLYQAGTGLMAGDFYDVFQLAPTRIAAVIGDVTGHGIEPSITAFQAKYLLRVFLLQYRDPAPGPRGAERHHVGAGTQRGDDLAVRGRVRHRGRNHALCLGRASAGLAVARPRCPSAALHGTVADAGPESHLPEPGGGSRPR